MRFIQILFTLASWTTWRAFAFTTSHNAVIQKTVTSRPTSTSALNSAASDTAVVEPSVGSSTVMKNINTASSLGKFKATLTKIGMLSYIASMCIALPVTMAPPALLHKTRLIKKSQREHLSVRAGQFCARWLMRIIPFADVNVTPADQKTDDPSIWVCNHISMMDIFFLMATSKKLRGKKARPIKIVYWKQLEDNPVNKIFFRSCGFIPVDMEANKAGETNSYDKKGFKQFLKLCKQAFSEGFDIGILPEGQLNPTPENGLQPVFTGAYTLAKMSRRPIRMIALHGTHKLWHPKEEIGMTVTDRKVKVRAYPAGTPFENGDDFANTFTKIIGHFGANGEDLPDSDLRELLYKTKDEDEERNRKELSPSELEFLQSL